MTIEEVMTRRVITVRPETSVQEAARLMITNSVSGLPVVDASGHVVGIISDGDLILRQRRPKVRPWWRLFFENGERLAREYRKIVGLTVGEVMTRPAVVIRCSRSRLPPRSWTIDRSGASPWCETVSSSAL